MKADNFDIVTDYSDIPEVLRLVVLAILNAPQEPSK